MLSAFNKETTFHIMAYVFWLVMCIVKHVVEAQKVGCHVFHLNPYYYLIANYLRMLTGLYAIMIVAKLAKLWKKSTVQDIETATYYFPDDNQQMVTFTEKYDKVQKQLETIAAMDDLLSGI